MSREMPQKLNRFNSVPIFHITTPNTVVEFKVPTSYAIPYDIQFFTSLLL